MMKLALAAPAVAAKLSAVPMALSSGEGAASFDVSAVMQSAVDSTQSQMFSVLAIVVPAIALVTAAVVGIKFGISWLRKIKG